MATYALQMDSHQARQHTLLIATSHQDQRAFLAAQLDADGHTVYEADHTAAVISRLSAHAIDMLVVGELEHPADGPALLRAVRGGKHPRIHPGQQITTRHPPPARSRTPTSTPSTRISTTRIRRRTPKPCTSYTTA
jgi:CheY-like chemotaxis protein